MNTYLFRATNGEALVPETFVLVRSQRMEDAIKSYIGSLITTECVPAETFLTFSLLKSWDTNGLSPADDCEI